MDLKTYKGNVFGAPQVLPGSGKTYYDSPWDDNTPSGWEDLLKRTPHQKKKKKGWVTIIRGLSGSGKSTYVKDKYPDATVASADNFFMVDGEYCFEQYRIAEAHQACWNTFLKAVWAEKTHVVVDNTNMRAWEYDNYVFEAKKHGYKVRIICMKAGLTDSTPISVLLERGTHGVPLRAIEQMKDNFEPDLGEEYV